MEVLIIDRGENSVEMTCGKKTAEVIYSPEMRYVRVLCKNASHRAYRGFGRMFDSFAEAKAAYKSSTMKAMIDCAESEIMG